MRTEYRALSQRGTWKDQEPLTAPFIEKRQSRRPSDGQRCGILQEPILDRREEYILILLTEVSVQSLHQKGRKHYLRVTRKLST